MEHKDVQAFKPLIRKALVNAMNSTQQNLKKGLRLKLWEICKTRTKKKSPDLFNFYKILSGCYMTIDKGRDTKCRREFKAPLFKRSTKNEETSENMGFNGKKV